MYARAIDENARDANRGKGRTWWPTSVGTENKIVEFPRSLFDPVEMPFEDRVFLAPAAMNDSLELQYGDWRAIPGDDDRGDPYVRGVSSMKPTSSKMRDVPPCPPSRTCCGTLRGR